MADIAFPLPRAGLLERARSFRRRLEPPDPLLLADMALGFYSLGMVMVSVKRDLAGGWAVVGPGYFGNFLFAIWRAQRSRNPRRKLRALFLGGAAGAVFATLVSDPWDMRVLFVVLICGTFFLLLDARRF